MPAAVMARNFGKDQCESQLQSFIAEFQPLQDALFNVRHS